jgi:hypothetical protein
MMIARVLSAAFVIPALMATLLSGCNTLNESAEHTMAEQRLAPPAAIVVHEFTISDQSAGGKNAVASDAEGAARAFQESLASHLVTAIRAMGLPAALPSAPLPPVGNVVTLEGSFVAVPAEDSADSAIVRLAQAWPGVVVEVQIYDTTETRDRLLEDREFQISETSSMSLDATAAGPTVPASKGQGAGAPISQAVQAKLDAAARDGGQAIAKQLQPFFADQGWLAHAPGS